MDTKQSLRELLAALTAAKDTNLLSVLTSLGQDTKTKIKFEILCYAHLACSAIDSTHLRATLPYLEKSGRLDLLAGVRETAESLGDFTTICRLQAMNHPVTSSTFVTSDFPQWFATKGLPWFDLYHDEEKNLWFILPSDVAFIQQLVNSLYPDQTNFWLELLSDLRARTNYSPIRLELLEQLSRGEEPVVYHEPLPRTVDECFEAYCQQHNLQILRQLQVGKTGSERCSSVFLVLDQDGLVKVYKEIPDTRLDRLERPNRNEAVLYNHLGPLTFLPRYYGTTHIDDKLSIMRQSVVYGQSLADYTTPGNLIATDTICYIIGQLAAHLAALHAMGVLHLDIRPENIKVNDQEVRLLDLGDATRIPDGATEVVAYSRDPRYTPPETLLRAKASTASDIFQLGVLFHTLLTGQHPLAETGEESESRELRLIRYGLANALLTYRHKHADERLRVITRMMNKNPSERPTAKEVAALLQSANRSHIVHRGRSPLPKSAQAVLFPARMGVPHRGHIDFMARIIELGFKLVVSLQMSYFENLDDPLPKCLVAKIITHSLLTRGFSPGDFQVILTPFFTTDQRHRLHFSMLPGRNQIVAVASGNPEVHELFAGSLPVIDQRMVFGEEAKPYETRSWGERLRTAIRMGDQETFQDLIAPGATDVVSFQELQTYCCREEWIEFIWGDENFGQVYAVVLDQTSSELLRTRVSAYSTPEKTILNQLPDCRLTDPNLRDTLIELNSEPYLLRFERTKLDTEKNQIITYCLVPITRNET